MRVWCFTGCSRCVCYWDGSTKVGTASGFSAGIATASESGLAAPNLAPACFGAVDSAVMSICGRFSGSGLSAKLRVSSTCQWCGLRPSVLGQDQFWDQKIGFGTVVLVLVLQVLCCVVKLNLVTLVVIMMSEDTAAFQVLFLVSLFCAWNITTVEFNSGVHLLKS